MKPDLWHLYQQMFKSRLFEEAVTRLWQDGKISGEMHLGTGEEAVVAGVVDHLRDGDSLALDHRGTAALLMRGVNPSLLLKEFMGHSDGLCGGMGGHMHLLSPHYLAASSGIVGASGPAAVGFALAAQHLRPTAVSIAFFGEGAMNQGMLLESLNLAKVWQLPVIFICKNNDWAITTRSRQVRSGPLSERARAFGMLAREIDGSDVTEVWNAAREGVDRARAGCGPMFLDARCVHFAGHFLGDPLLRRAHHPVTEMKGALGPMLLALVSRKGARRRERVDSMKNVASLIRDARDAETSKHLDPIFATRQLLETDPQRLDVMESALRQEIRAAVTDAQHNQVTAHAPLALASRIEKNGDAAR